MTLHAAICAEQTKQRVEIGFWKIPKFHNEEVVTLARKAARSKFTPTELTEIGQRLRAEKERNNLMTGPSQSAETKDTKLVLSPKSTNKIVEKQAPAQTSRVSSKKDNPKAAGTGPVNLALFEQSLHC